MNVRDFLTAAALKFGARPVLRFRNADVSIAALTDMVDRLSAAFAAFGVEKGDRVVILAGNQPAWIAAYLAALARGAIAVPVNPALTRNEVGYIVEHAAPQVVVLDHALQEIVAPSSVPHMITLGEGGTFGEVLAAHSPDPSAMRMRDEDPAVIFYTSGTTGRPKGVMLSHSSVSFIANMVPDLYRFSSADTSLICGSLSFIYSILTNFTSCLNAGSTVHLTERFHPAEVLRTIEREKISVFMGVPTMYVMMLDWAKDQEVDISCLRLCICSGSSLPWNLVLRFQDRFGYPLYDLWGMTEGTPITSYDPFADEVRPDSCGHALQRCGVRVVDDAGQDLPSETVGEVLLSGPAVMLGYYKNREATFETLKDGWVRTGDLGRLDADGYLYIVGRKKDLIIRGGANIYPTEVEDVIYGHSAVSECAVIGRPDPTFGEIVEAVVVRREGLGAGEADIRAHCRSHLAEYKVPAIVTFVDALPKGPTGKILKRQLREMQAA